MPPNPPESEAGPSADGRPAMLYPIGSVKPPLKVGRGPSLIVFPASAAIRALIERAKKSLPELQQIPVPEDGLPNRLAPTSTQTVLQLQLELEKEYQKITSVSAKVTQAHNLTLFHGETVIGSSYPSILVPLGAIGQPLIEKFERLPWDGSQLLCIIGEVMITVIGPDRLGAIIVAFPEDAFPAVPV